MQIVLKRGFSCWAHPRTGRSELRRVEGHPAWHCQSTFLPPSPLWEPRSPPFFTLPRTPERTTFIEQPQALSPFSCWSGEAKTDQNGGEQWHQAPAHPPAPWRWRPSFPASCRPEGGGRRPSPSPLVPLLQSTPLRALHKTLLGTTPVGDLPDEAPLQSTRGSEAPTHPTMPPTMTNAWVC